MSSEKSPDQSGEKSSEKAPAEKTATEKTGSPKAAAPKEYASSIVAILVVLLAAAAIWWYQFSTQPARTIERAVSLLEQEKFDELRVELTKLEGIDDYELHDQVLRGAMLVKERKYRAADKYFRYLPDDERIKVIGLLYQGISQYNQQEYEQAIADFEQILALEPDNEDATEWIEKSRQQLQPAQMLSRAFDAIKLGDWNRFKTLTERVGEDKEDKSAQAYYHFMQAHIQLHEGKVPQAVLSMEQASAESDLRERSLTGIAEAYAALRQNRVAELKYLDVLKDYEHSVKAHTWLASHYFDQGAMDFAGHHLGELSRLEPQNPRPSRLMGLISHDFKNYEEAIKHYTESLQRNPSPNAKDEILIEMAECLIALNNYDDALKALQDPALDEIASDQYIVKRDVSLARCYVAKGDLGLAMVRLEKAISMIPTDLEALLAMGEIHLAESRLPKAVETFEKAVKYHPFDHTAQFKLSQVYRRNGDTEKADVHEARAEEIKSLNEQLTELGRKAATDPDDAESRYQSGLIALQLGKPKLAVLWFQNVLSINPLDERARAKLEEIMKTMSNTGVPLKIENVPDSKQSDTDQDPQENPPQKNTSENPGKGETENLKSESTESPAIPKTEIEKSSKPKE